MESSLLQESLPEQARGWDLTDYLLADVFHAMTGEPHPSRPEATSRAERYRKLRARLEQQRARVEAPAPPTS